MPEGIVILITAVLAGGLGLFMGWLLGARRQTGAPADARLENELRQQLAQRETELAQTREQLSQSRTSLATAQANQAAAEAEAAGAKRITPFWRTLKTGGEINPKYPGGAEHVAQRLRAEGHQIIAKGKRLLLADFEEKLFTRFN